MSHTQTRPTPSFEEFHKHARDLHSARREVRSRNGEDPAEIIEAEALEPSVIEVAVELALDDAQRHGELSVALAYAAREPRLRDRVDAEREAWRMAGEALVWEGGHSLTGPVRRALQRRGLIGSGTAVTFDR